MRLRTIAENIKRSEFFDFYALVYVYQELDRLTGSDVDYRREVRQNLHFLAKYIFNDHMDQLATIISNRWMNEGRKGNDLYHDNPGNLDIYRKYGIRLEVDDDFGVHDFVDDNDVHKLSVGQQAKLIGELIATGHHGFTGNRWEDLGRKFIELAKTNVENLNGLILTIDKIYGLMHHGGSILDYFDEHAWLEKALHSRALTSPKNLLYNASSQIRELLTSANIGIPRQERISLPQEIGVALRRVEQSWKLFGLNYKIIDDKTFKLGLTVRVAIPPNSNEAVIIGWPKWHGYDKWGERGHDYDADEEFIVEVIGIVEDGTIMLYDMDENQVSYESIAINSRRGYRYGARQIATSILSKAANHAAKLERQMAAKM